MLVLLRIFPRPTVAYTKLIHIDCLVHITVAAILYSVWVRRSSISPVSCDLFKEIVNDYVTLFRWMLYTIISWSSSAPPSAPAAVLVIVVVIVTAVRAKMLLTSSKDGGNLVALYAHKF